MLKKIAKKIWHLLGYWGHTFPPFGFFYFNITNFVDMLIVFFYCQRKFAGLDHVNCSAGRLSEANVLDLVTIGFNNAEVIDWQIKFLKNNLKDSYYFTVADNSETEIAARKIKAVCAKYEVGYIRLPSHVYKGKFPSWSHGLALNWVYRNFFRPRGADYFGFLDHDIFPTKPTSVIPILKDSPMYGLVHHRGPIWYLWPGFCFFRKSLFDGRKANFSTGAVLNFFSNYLLDTGGANWKPIYSKTTPDRVCQPLHRFAFLRDRPSDDGKLYDMVDEQTLKKNYNVNILGADEKYMDFLDDWLHVRRMGYGDPKFAELKLKVLLTFSS